MCPWNFVYEYIYLYFVAYLICLPVNHESLASKTLASEDRLQTMQLKSLPFKAGTINFCCYSSDLMKFHHGQSINSLQGNDCCFPSLYHSACELLLRNLKNTWDCCAYSYIIIFCGIGIRSGRSFRIPVVKSLFSMCNLFWWRVYFSSSLVLIFCCPSKKLTREG